MIVVHNELMSLYNDIPVGKFFSTKTFYKAIDINSKSFRKRISTNIYRTTKDHDYIVKLSLNKCIIDGKSESIIVKVDKDNTLPYSHNSLINHEISIDDFKQYPQIQNIKNIFLGNNKNVSNITDSIIDELYELYIENHPKLKFNKTIWIKNLKKSLEKY